MVLIGLVLLAAAAVFGIDIAAQNLTNLDVDIFGQTFATTPAALFVAGVITGIVGALGMIMMRDGMIRLRRRRATVRETAAERDRLAAAYAAEHREEPAHDNVDLRERVREREQDREHVSAF